ncbi:MAG: hypothetical protein IIU39_07905 [Ruminococcus sp.]|nr:hypothetical protein [Ruminococcus sp.]
MSLKSYINKNRKRLRKRKSLIVFLSIISILGLTTATYAWFTVNTFAGVQDFELQISTADDLRVSMENHGSDIEKYTHVITNDMINSYLRKNYNLTMKDILLDPVTTNNGKNFSYQNGSKAKPNDKTGSYFEFECYFIATRAMNVHLSNEGIEDGKKVVGTKVTSSSPSPLNDVVKANRIAFDPDGSSVKTYEPNKGRSVTSLSTFDLPSGTMNYNSSNNLFPLEKLTPKKVAVRLWLEGEDPECDNDIQRSELKVRLSFAGIREGQTAPGQ